MEMVADKNGEYFIRSQSVKKTERKKRDTLLKNILIKKNIKPMELAEKVKMARNQISDIISGKQTNVMLDTAKKICNATGTRLDETFGEGRVDVKSQILEYINLQISSFKSADDGFFWCSKIKEEIEKIK